MSEKEVELKELLDLHLEGKATISEVACRYKKSKRQILRKKKDYLAHGLSGLISKKRGKTSNRASLHKIKPQVINILNNPVFKGFKPKLASEVLEKRYNLFVNRETLRQWMIEEGLWQPKKRKEKKIYQRRKRRERFGSLIQLDGSDHDWFEGRGPRCTLLMTIDDATGRICAGRFESSESTLNYFHLMKDHIELYGRPLQLYSDKHSVFKVNAKGAKHHITQFTRAMKELSIEVVCAHSPQAKGRIERSFGTHQDRLIKLMRLEGISCVDKANKYLQKYIIEHNQQFSRPALNLDDAHTPLSSNHDLNKTFSVIETRKISKNLEITYHNEILQIELPERRHRLVGSTCIVRKTMSGEIIVEYNGEELPWTYFKDLPAEYPSIIESKEINHMFRSTKKKKSPKNHPWRSFSRRKQKV